MYICLIIVDIWSCTIYVLWTVAIWSCTILRLLNNRWHDNCTQQCKVADWFRVRNDNPFATLRWQLTTQRIICTIYVCEIIVDRTIAYHNATSPIGFIYVFTIGWWTVVIWVCTVYVLWMVVIWSCTIYVCLILVNMTIAHKAKSPIGFIYVFAIYVLRTVAIWSCTI